MSKWISIKKMVPADGIKVLVLSSSYGHIYEAKLYRFKNGKIKWQNYDTSIYDITHWMPLPEPPEDK